MDFNYKETLFNIDILVPERSQLKYMEPVSKLNIFEPSSNNFDPLGLFSTTIFGQVGSEDRNNRFSYIDLNMSILHPLIYSHIITAKAFYKDIMAGKKYAVYDNKLKDLVPADEEEGSTGYTFFMDTISKIKMLDNNSDMRAFKIYMISKYATDPYMLKQLLVMPAGMRDYTVTKEGKPEEDEINDIYRKVMTLVNSIRNITTTKETLESVDVVRFRIQETVLTLYDHIISLLDGKHKQIQGKWGARGLLYGTRNVITPSLARVTNLNDFKTSVTIDHTTIGLYQYARAITPITMNKLHSVFISKLFTPDSDAGYLVSMKSMKTTLTNIPIRERDTWLTIDGLDSLLGNLEQESLRSLPIVINKMYLMVVHDDGKNITPIFNTETMSDELDVKYLRPITYYELLYIALADTFDKYRGLLTRYPVINLGGIYPCKTYIKSSTKGRNVTIKLLGKEIPVTEYPDYKQPYYNSLSPHYAFLDALGADFDGDKVNFTVVYTEDSINEIDKLINSKQFYLSPDNQLVFSPVTDTLKYTVAALNNGMVYE